MLPLPLVSDALESIGDIVSAAVATSNAPIRKLLMDIVSPKKTSNASDRRHHQNTFKETLRLRYACIDGENQGVTRCMVLDKFFSTNVVTASHIIGLTNRLSLTALNLNPDSDIWSDRNGLLLYQDFEYKYESQDIVSYLIFCGFYVFVSSL